jgi:regulatory protein
MVITPKDYALRLLSARSYTEKGLERKMRQKGYNIEDITEVVSWCREQRFVNDREYALSFIRSRDILKPRGQRVLRLELIKKGVPVSIIDDTLTAVFDDRDERQLATDVLSRKLPSWRTLNRETKWRRAYSLLARRGFNHNIICEVLNEQIPKKVEDNRHDWAFDGESGKDQAID